MIRHIGYKIVSEFHEPSGKARVWVHRSLDGGPWQPVGRRGHTSELHAHDAMMNNIRADRAAATRLGIRVKFDGAFRCDCGGRTMDDGSFVHAETCER